MLKVQVFVKVIPIISVLSIFLCACEWKPPRRPLPQVQMNTQQELNEIQVQDQQVPTTLKTTVQVQDQIIQKVDDSESIHSENLHKEVMIADEHIKPSSNLLNPTPLAKETVPANNQEPTKEPTPADHQASTSSNTNNQAPTPADNQAPTPADNQAPTPVDNQEPTPADNQAPTPADNQAPTPSQVNSTEKEVFRVAKKQQVSEIIDDSVLKINEFSVGRYIERNQAQHKFARYESNGIGFVAFLKTENIQKAMGLNVIWTHPKHKQITKIHVKKGNKVNTWIDIKLPINESKRFGAWQVELRTIKTNLLLAKTSFELVKP
jgi:hypothetical protein